MSSGHLSTSFWETFLFRFDNSCSRTKHNICIFIQHTLLIHTSTVYSQCIHKFWVAISNGGPGFPFLDKLEILVDVSLAASFTPCFVLPKTVSSAHTSQHQKVGGGFLRTHWQRSRPRLRPRKIEQFCVLCGTGVLDLEGGLY